jgi:hypothetical protein
LSDDQFRITIEEIIRNRGGTLHSASLPREAKQAPQFTTHVPRLSIKTVIYSIPGGFELSIDTVECWPNGFTAWICAIGDVEQQPNEDVLFTQKHGNQARIPQSSLRFGVVYSDGRSCTLVNNPDRSGFGGALLTSIDGDFMNHSHISQRLNFWPCSPAGDIAIVAEWPGRGMPVQVANIDGSAVMHGCKEAASIG